MNQLHEVSSLENGAKIVFSSCDYYSLAENLLKGEEPKWDNSNTINEWMDGWQIPKKYRLKHNFVIIQLATEANLFFICVDTSFYRNEFPAQFSIQAAKIPSILDVNQDRKNRFGKHKKATKEEIRCIEQIKSETWPYLINRTNLESGCTLMNKRFFKVRYLAGNINYVRLNIFPNGGISRLRIYGKPMHIYTSITNDQFDLVSRIHDGCCISYSNCYEGHPNNLLIPRKASIRTDGWIIMKKTNRTFISEESQESSEKIEENEEESKEESEITEWAIFKLGHIGKIYSVVIDTSFFEEDAPSFIRVYGKPKDISELWQIIVPYTKVMPGTEQTISVTENKTYMTHVKLEFKPNGGINRFRVIGRCQFYDGHAC